MSELWHRIYFLIDEKYSSYEIALNIFREYLNGFSMNQSELIKIVTLHLKSIISFFLLALHTDIKVYSLLFVIIDSIFQYTADALMQ